MSAREVRSCDYCGKEKPELGKIEEPWIFTQGPLLIHEKGGKMTQFAAQQDFCGIVCMTQKILKTLSVADVIRDDANAIERLVRDGKPGLLPNEVENLRLPSKK